MTITDSDKRPPPRDDKLTRIGVRHIWFHDNFTFAGAGMDSQYSSISNTPCYQVNNGSRYVTCEFIPAWQTFEFSFHAMNAGKDEVRVRYVAAARIASWQREDGGR